MAATKLRTVRKARGELVDARTDLFSFGAVLYEMATNQRAFSGATTAVIFDGILHKSPTPPVQLNTALPAEMEGSSARHWRKTATCAITAPVICVRT